MDNGHFKDQTLDRIGNQSNVAQFVSFGPNLDQRFSRVRGYAPNHRFESVENAAEALIRASAEHTANVRSYAPFDPKSRKFSYGLSTPTAILAEVRSLAASGYHTIVNETIDVGDGGVSGVAFGEVLEFAPDDTPRAVEKPGTAALPRELGMDLLATVFGFSPELPVDPNTRVEFSLHPLRRGYSHSHTIIWETESFDHPPEAPLIKWPNRFSRHLGDKAYGLLIAHFLGLPVPRTTVISRRVSPFSFGRDTGSVETWIRTCPVEQMPGKFTTKLGWTDPFDLLHREDPGGTEIASILSQASVHPAYSGAFVTHTDGSVLEGVKGKGDDFMSGRRGPEDLPEDIASSVSELFSQATRGLGPCRGEWVHDGSSPWVVQLHVGGAPGSKATIFPGDASRYEEFPVSGGIEKLRDLIEQIRGTDTGITLVGEVGVTSHFGDVLRKARIPSRLALSQD